MSTSVILILSALALSQASYPYWPKHFRWSYAGALPGYHCLLVNEPGDPHYWENNYLCWEQGWDSPGFRWSYAGVIPGMRCTAVNEPGDPHYWGNNFLCVPSDSPYDFSFSHAGRILGKGCVLMNEPGDPHYWTDNYLCATAGSF